MNQYDASMAKTRLCRILKKSLNEEIKNPRISEERARYGMKAHKTNLRVNDSLEQPMSNCSAG